MIKPIWFAVETRVRAEYAALRDINAIDGLTAYLPQETRIKRTYKGKVEVQHPLMPGFIFVSSSVPMITDVNSPDYPHPIHDVLKLASVRDIVRGAGGGIHPIRPRIVDGWAVDFVEDLQEREAAGAFDFRPRQKAEKKSRFMKGAFKDQLAEVMKSLYPDVAETRLAA